MDLYAYLLKGVGPFVRKSGIAFEDSLNWVGDRLDDFFGAIDWAINRVLDGIDYIVDGLDWLSEKLGF